MNHSRSQESDGSDGADAPGDAPGARTLRHLSHDIRSAMSDVIGGLRLVDPARLDPQTQTQLDRVRSAADTLASLVDHALFAAAGESPMAHDPGPVSLEDWLDNLSDRWGGQAAERNRTFRVQRIGRLPKSLNVPPVALTRVVGNLVGNALRHVPDGDVEVIVSGEASHGLIISVRDQGPGFPTEVLEGKEHSGIGATAGSGLGLKIAQNLSAAFGAVLTLDNIETGACATLRMGPERLGDSVPEAGVAAMPDLSGLQILVAEDNLTNQTILRHMLDAMHAEATFVADGRAALGELTEKVYDIALLDIEMPELSGLEVMEAVRAMGGDLAAMPLVAITAYVLRDNREAIYAAGADGIIGKPVASTEDLGRAVLRHVGNGPPEPAPDVLLSEGSVLDHRQMDQLLRAAGTDGRQELLQRLSEDLTTTLHLLDQAMERQDHSELRAQTHILIAVSGAVGADRLCRMSEALNIAAKRRMTDRYGSLFAPLRSDLLALMEEVARRGDGPLTPG